jgi:hypothetical protein
MGRGSERNLERPCHKQCLPSVITPSAAADVVAVAACCHALTLLLLLLLLATRSACTQTLKRIVHGVLVFDSSLFIH